MKTEIQKFKKEFVHEFTEGKEPVEKIMSVPCPKIRTFYTSKWYPKNQEVNTQPSMTIPDQAMTVMEIMQRFASGLPAIGQKVPYYEEEEGDLTDLQKMDLAERQEYIEEKMAEIKEIKDRVEKRKNDAANARLNKTIQERVNQKLQEQQEKGGLPNEQK